MNDFAVTNQNERPPGGGLDESAATIDPAVDLEILRDIPKQFEINDEKSANWLVRKIAAARTYGENVKQWAEQELNRAAREEKTLMFLFGRQAETWARAELSKQRPRKSISVPSGTIGFRKTGPTLAIIDEAAVIVWAKIHCPAAVCTSERLMRSQFNQYFKATGCLPEHGVQLEGETEKFFIR